LYANVPDWDTTKRTGLRVLSQGATAASTPLVPILKKTSAYVHATTDHAKHNLNSAVNRTAKTVKYAMNTTADILANEMAEAYQSLPSATTVLNSAHVLTKNAVQTAVPLVGSTSKTIASALVSLGQLSLTSSLTMAQYLMRMGALVDVTGLKNVVLNSNIFMGVEEVPEKERLRAVKDPDVAPGEKIIKTVETTLLPMGGDWSEGRFRQTRQRLERKSPDAVHTLHVPLKDGNFQKTRRSTRIARMKQT